MCFHITIHIFIYSSAFFLNVPLCYSGTDNISVIGLTSCEKGENHSGYFGFRDVTNNTKIIDDGIIDIVDSNWKYNN
ncbi:MAG TPA: hypothetical protein VJ767_04250 [Nitrososphaeraceae archaeon]|nr:hypothetical protein [Nitrososphaeraceae archaeon]